MAKSTPPAVSNTKATMPSPSIISVLSCTNFSPVIVLAIVIPSSMVTRFASSFCAVCDRLLSTPHSRIRLPNIRKPIRASDEGAISPASTVTAIGNIMRAVRDARLLASNFIRILRSFSEVSALMTGGCIIGTRAIYEYAATEIGPSRSRAICVATIIDVGPSAAPMIPIEAACLMSKPISVASTIVIKIPNCAAAPKSNSIGR